MLALHLRLLSHPLAGCSGAEHSPLAHEPSLERPQSSCALPCKVDRGTENAGGFLRSMEPHRILCLDEVEVELGFALEVAGGGQLLVRLASRTGRLEVR